MALGVLRPWNQDPALLAQRLRKGRNGLWDSPTKLSEPGISLPRDSPFLASGVWKPKKHSGRNWKLKGKEEASRKWWIGIQSERARLWRTCLKSHSKPVQAGVGGTRRCILMVGGLKVLCLGKGSLYTMELFIESSLMGWSFLKSQILAG